MDVFRRILGSCPTLEDKLSAISCMVFCLRQDFIEGKKCLGRRYHLDPLIDMIVIDCGIKLSQVEQALYDCESDEQYGLAPRAYAIFSGMLCQKLIGIPIPERKSDKNDNSTTTRYAGPKFQNSPSPTDLPIPSEGFFSVKSVKSVKV